MRARGEGTIGGWPTAVAAAAVLVLVLVLAMAVLAVPRPVWRAARRVQWPCRPRAG